VHIVLAADDPQAFDLLVMDEATGFSETFQNSSIADGARRVDQVLMGSSLIRVQTNADGTPQLPSARPPATLESPDASMPWPKLSGGVDSELITNPDVYAPARGKKGIFALEDTPAFNLLCVPPDSSDWPLAAVYARALEYCKRRLAFLLVDAPSHWLDASDAAQGLSALGLETDGANGAIYFPQLVEDDGLPHPPSGAVAGVIAQTDSARGVWKAAAGPSAHLAGAQSLSVSLTDQEQGELNPLGVNCVRSLPNIGNVIWGARTLRGAEALADEYK
jgi:hypothetical protein